MAIKRVYWDTSCFISYLSGTHPNEVQRSKICEDILNCARNDQIEVWTSVWTICETIRPRVDSTPQPTPLWASLLEATDKDGKLLHPEAPINFKKIWEFYERNTRATRLLPEADAKRIRAMFDWSWIKKIQVFPAIAHKATEIARAHNMKPGDSIHVASALARNCDVIQRWDRDYTRTDSLIPSEEPAWLSKQAPLELKAPDSE
jgi:predicted nucleic acid-binding protein